MAGFPGLVRTGGQTTRGLVLGGSRMDSRRDAGVGAAWVCSDAAYDAGVGQSTPKQHPTPGGTQRGVSVLQYDIAGGSEEEGVSEAGGSEPGGGEVSGGSELSA